MEVHGSGCRDHGLLGPGGLEVHSGAGPEAQQRLGLDLPTVSKQLWRRLSGAVAKGVRMLLRAFGAGEAVPAPQ